MNLATAEQIESFLNAPGVSQVVVRHVQKVEIIPRLKEDQFARQREHWSKLHTQSFDATSFEAWVKAIPGCSACQRDFRKIVESNPPRYNDWNRWTFEAHNAVNFKLGKPEFTFEQACQQWDWNLTQGTDDAITEDSS
jgi:hypothetical protein